MKYINDSNRVVICGSCWHLSRVKHSAKYLQYLLFHANFRNRWSQPHLELLKKCMRSVCNLEATSNKYHYHRYLTAFGLTFNHKSADRHEKIISFVINLISKWVWKRVRTDILTILSLAPLSRIVLPGNCSLYHCSNVVFGILGAGVSVDKSFYEFIVSSPAFPA